MPGRRDGKLVAPTESSGVIADAVLGIGRDVPGQLDEYDLTGALDSIWDVVRGLNRHVEQTKPWEIAKDESRVEELDRVLYELADGLRAVAVAISSYPPRLRADPRRAAAARRSLLGISLRQVVRSPPRASRPLSRSSRASTFRPRPLDRYTRT